MASTDIATAVESLKSYHPRTVIPFIGSGFTVDLGYPSWSGLLFEMADLVRVHSPELATVMKSRIDGRRFRSAADVFYEPEVPAVERVRFLKRVFETTPDLARRHRLLGSLPVGAFVTTNFDPTVERAAVVHGRQCVTYAGGDRFLRFNSNYPLYMESFGKMVRTSTCVLKIHNDTSDCENIVLSGESFGSLRQVRGFNVFYQNALRNSHLMMIGFGGDDPNFLGAIIDDLRHYSGYGIGESYLFLANNVLAPEGLDGTPIRVVSYDPANGHGAIEGLLKELNDAWLSCLNREDESVSREKAELRESNLPGEQVPLMEMPFSRTPTIFEVLIPAVQGHFDKRIVEVVSENMVREAIAIARPHSDERSIANRLAQRYRIGLDKASALVSRHRKEAEQTMAAAADPVVSLAQGVRSRCLAFDSAFAVALSALEKVVRSSIELALEEYGCALALSLIKGDRPSESDLAHVVRTLVVKQSWAGVGDADKDAILLAIPDLFLRPTVEEAAVINRLAVTATAFGLIQALPSLDVAMDLTPAAIYLDTTCVLPLITKAEPRCSAFYQLISMARERGIAVCFLESFISEVASHYRSALTILRDSKINTIGALTAEIGNSVEDYVNVFLLMVCRGGYDPDLSPADVLRGMWRNGSEGMFRSSVRGIGVRIVSPRSSVPDEALIQQIILGKKNWYARTVAARTKLARNEAIQMLELQSSVSAGRPAWFATADAQLRRVLRKQDTVGAEYVLPVAGIIGLLEALGTGYDMSHAYSRLLWTPNVRDEIDQVLGGAIRQMIESCDTEMRPPIEHARKLAAKEYLGRLREVVEGRDDLEIDTVPDTGKVIRDSVFFGIGRAIEEEQRKRALRGETPNPKRR